MKRLWVILALAGCPRQRRPSRLRQAHLAAGFTRDRHERLVWIDSYPRGRPLGSGPSHRGPARVPTTPSHWDLGISVGPLRAEVLALWMGTTRSFCSSSFVLTVALHARPRRLSFAPGSRSRQCGFRGGTRLGGGGQMTTARCACSGLELPGTRDLRLARSVGARASGPFRAAALLRRLCQPRRCVLFTSGLAGLVQRAGAAAPS